MRRDTPTFLFTFPFAHIWRRYQDRCLASTQPQGTGPAPSFLEASYNSSPLSSSDRSYKLGYYTQPSRTRDRKSSGSALSNALNQFMTRLDREGSIRGGNADLAARVKQEADVAGVSTAYSGSYVIG
jgi:hypothetical protein